MVIRARIILCFEARRSVDSTGLRPPRKWRLKPVKSHKVRTDGKTVAKSTSSRKEDGRSTEVYWRRLKDHIHGEGTFELDRFCAWRKADKATLSFHTEILGRFICHELSLLKR